MATTTMVIRGTMSAICVVKMAMMVTTDCHDDDVDASDKTENAEDGLGEEATVTMMIMNVLSHDG